MVVSKFFFNNDLYLLIKKTPEAFIYALTSISLTYFFIVMNMLGFHELSIKISFLQSLVAILTIGLAGDLRSIYLSDKKYFIPIVYVRFILFVIGLILLLIAHYYYFLNISRASITIFFSLTIRRLLDWFDEILIATINIKIKEEKHLFVNSYFLVQAIFILILPFFFKFYSSNIYAYFIFWSFLTIFLMRKMYLKFYFNVLKGLHSSEIKLFISFNYSKIIFYQHLSTLLINFGNLGLRYFIALVFPPISAAMIISSFSIGSFPFTIISNSLLPNIMSGLEIKKVFQYTKIYIILYFFLMLLIFVLSKKYTLDNINFSYLIIFMSFLGGGLLLSSNSLRLYNVQIMKKHTLLEDFIIHASFFIILYYIYSTHNINYYIYSVNILSFLSFFIYFNLYKTYYFELSQSYLFIIFLLRLIFLPLIIYCFYKL